MEEEREDPLNLLIASAEFRVKSSRCLFHPPFVTGKRSDFYILSIQSFEHTSAQEDRSLNSRAK